MDNSSAPVRFNEKWIVTIIWLALLLLLYYTSANGALASFGGNLRNFYTSVSGSTQAFEITTMAISTAVVMLLAGIALVYE